MLHYKTFRILELLISPLLKFGLSLFEKWHNARPIDYIYERPIEYAFTLKNLLNNHCLTILDVGTGRSAFPALLVNCGFKISCIDQINNYWVTKIFNRHYYIHDDDITNSRQKSSSFDAITCISVLEHIEDYQNAVKEMARIVKPGGVIILSFPYCHDQYYDNVYKHPDSDEDSSTYKYIARSYSDEEINKWCEEHGLEITETEYFRGWKGKLWRTGGRINFPESTPTKENANGVCHVFRKK